MGPSVLRQWSSVILRATHAIQGSRAAGPLLLGRAPATLATVFLLAAMLVCTPGCRSLPHRAPAPAAVLSAAAENAPDLRFGRVEEYAGDQLYNYMDGAAVTYLEHHFRTLAACDVFRGGDQAKIELYEMASPADAARLYAQLTASPGTPFPSGEAGCAWDGFEPEALWRRGPFLVRLLGYAKDRGAAASLLREVAAALDAQLYRH